MQRGDHRRETRPRRDRVDSREVGCQRRHALFFDLLFVDAARVIVAALARIEIGRIG
jgi:hypothetical protein